MCHCSFICCLPGCYKHATGAAEKQGGQPRLRNNPEPRFAPSSPCACPRCRDLKNNLEEITIRKNQCLCDVYDPLSKSRQVLTHKFGNLTSVGGSNVFRLFLTFFDQNQGRNSNIQSTFNQTFPKNASLDTAGYALQPFNHRLPLPRAHAAGR